MKILVTAEDIALGVRMDGCECPIARACRRAGLANPDVEGERLGMIAVTDPSEEGGWRYYTLPAKADAFVTAFDAGEPVEPFEFEIT